MAYAADLSLNELGGERPELILISPNDPKAMTRYVSECQQLEIPYIYDPSQQIPRLTGEELRQGLEGSLALFVNKYEYEMVQRRTGLSQKDIQARSHFTVVTLGEQGSVIYVDGEELEIPVVTPEEITDPTGVGDAFRGGFLAGYARAWDLKTCGQMGSVAAAFCLEQEGPQGHSFTPAEFVSRFRDHFDDQGKLDALIKI